MQNKIFNIQTPENFKQVAFSVFRHQFENNKVYRSFCDLLYIHPSDVHTLEDIPFLPIEFFKSKKIISSLEEVQEVFTSSCHWFGGELLARMDRACSIAS